MAERFRDFMREAPHRTLDSILDRVTEIPVTVSDSITSTLDRLPLGDAGPHRAVDTFVKSAVSALRSIGEIPMRTLDVPWEQLRRRVG